MTIDKIKREKIINTEPLEERTQEVEDVLQGLLPEEKILVLNNIKNRIYKEIQDLRVADTMGNNPLMNWANKFVNKNGKDLV